jgi:hypothetical protein
LALSWIGGRVAACFEVGEEVWETVC